MESVVASAPQTLVDSLDFNLGATAEYVSQRVQTTFQPSGGSQYDPVGGTRIVRFHLADEEGWLDPASVRVQFDIHNTGAADLETVNLVPSCLFSRLLIKCGGQVVEDINSYNRVAYMMQQLVNPHALQDMESEGFGGVAQIGGGFSRRVSLKLMSGLLGQSKSLPLKMLSGLTIELQLADPNDWCVSTAGIINRSQTYRLENVELACDLMTLDPALQQQYMSYVLSQNFLPVKYSTHIVTEQTITAEKFSISLSRAVSRLQSVFFSFENTDRQTQLLKKTNQLYHPAQGHVAVQDFEWQLKIGGKRFPIYPVRGFGATFHRLAQAVGVSSSSCFSFSMTPVAYRQNNFVGGVDCEKVPLCFTGIDTRGGDLITIEGKGFGEANPAGANGRPTSITVVLYSEQILNIRDNGVDVVD